MGSTDDEQGAPDSWELADVEDSMWRLLSKKSASTSQIQGEESQSSLVSSNSLNSEGEDQRINQVDQFLREAIQNPRERLSVLRMEQDVEKFLHNPRQQELEFSQLPTSYLRLAAHRLAQHYCMQSSVAVDNSSLDVTANKIIIRKTLQTRAPPIRLADIPVSLPQDEKHNMVKVAIKQRPQKGSHHNSGYGSDSKNSNQAKSVEERKEEYNRARARIFSLSHNSQAGSKPIKESTSFENLHTRDNLRSEENSCMDEPRNYSKTTSDVAPQGPGGFDMEALFTRIDTIVETRVTAFEERLASRITELHHRMDTLDDEIFNVKGYMETMHAKRDPFEMHQKPARWPPRILFPE